MTLDTRQRRSLIVFVLAALIMAAPFTLQRVAASSDGPTITVVGDSITASYNDHDGDAKQGWWSFVGRHYGARVTTYAEPGSGYLRRGDQCRGTRFHDRPLALLTRSPDVMIIEGGRNDWLDCRDGRYVVAQTAAVTRAVDRYLTDVRAAVRPTTRVVVLGPIWGPRDALYEGRIRGIVRDAAARHRMEFIDVRDVLTSERVVDGTHPNRAGSLALADHVVAGIGASLS